MRGQSAARRLALAACFAAGVVFVPTAASESAPGLTVSVPAHQTVLALRRQLFFQKLMCSAACDVTTIVSLTLDEARTLGYAGPAHAQIPVASSFAQLKPRTSTQVAFVVNAQGKKLLAKAKKSLRISAILTAIPHKRPSPRTSAQWDVTLK
jgi:hypothetical protein